MGFFKFKSVYLIINGSLGFNWFELIKEKVIEGECRLVGFLVYMVISYLGIFGGLFFLRLEE